MQRIFTNTNTRNIDANTRETNENTKKYNLRFTVACNRSGQMVRSGKATNIHKFTTRRLGLRRPRNIPALNSETFDSRPQTKKCYNILA